MNTNLRSLAKTFTAKLAAVADTLEDVEREAKDALAALTLLNGTMNHKTKSRARSEPVKRKAPTISPKRMRALKLQGQYLGYTRTLTKEQKAQVTATRESDGMQAAIRLARSLHA